MNKIVPVLVMVLAGVLTMVWSSPGSAYVSNWIIGNAYANSDNSSKDNSSKDNSSKDNSSKDNSSKDNSSKDNSSKDKSSSSSSYSITTPVCDCTGQVTSADAAATKADDDAVKAQDDVDKAKSEDDKATEDDSKTILCHVPLGNSGNPQTLYLPPSAVSAHLSEHPDDYLGACAGDDSKNKQDIDKSKSEADKSKSDADKALSEADQAKSDADKAKSDADQNKSSMDAALAAGGNPCTCADGSTGTWIYGNPGDSVSPNKSLRQIRGQ